MEINNVKSPKAIERKEEILRKATQLFYENGYDNTSIRELANAVGLSIAGLYYFFQNKEEILFEVLNDALSNLFETIQSAITTNDPQQNITQIIDHMVEQVVGHKMEMGLLLGESKRLNPEQLSIINAKKNTIYNLVKKELIKLADQGNLKDFNITFVTFGIFAIINYIHLWYDPSGPLSPEQFAEETTKLLFFGILKE